MDTGTERHYGHGPARDAGAANPVLVEATRGELVESRHRAAFAVVDAAGRVVSSAGDIARPVYARSGLKPIQALPLVETGAAEAYDLSDAEIALACASHSGEPRHVDAVLAWLDRLGFGETDLVCGAQPAPQGGQRQTPGRPDKRGPAHDNCSGKHAGFITVAHHLGHPAAGYHRDDHPVQQRVRATLEQMAGLDLAAAPRGIDGCGIPVIAMPLTNIACAMARLADPTGQPDPRQAACATIRAAMAARPDMVGGKGRFDTRVMTVTGAAALIKGGAEGVYCGALAGPGLGIALKVDDGSGPAAAFVMGRLLCRLGVLDDAATATLDDALAPVLCDRSGAAVGRLRPGPGWRACI